MSDNNTVRRSFSFDPLDDHDVLKWLAAQPNASDAVRRVVRAHIAGPSLAEIAAKLDRLERGMGELASIVKYSAGSHR
jgi:hypothetical protein